MIDAGDVPAKNKMFIQSIAQYISETNQKMKYEADNGIYISKILVTHAHLDHFCAVDGIIQMLKQYG